MPLRTYDFADVKKYFKKGNLRGRGATAEVYAVGKKYGVKVLLSQTFRDVDVQAQQQMWSGFEQECRIGASLHHPNIMAVKGISKTPLGARSSFCTFTQYFLKQTQIV